MTLRLLKSLRTTAPKDHRPTTADSSFRLTERFLTPGRLVSGRIIEWMCRPTLFLAIVLAGSLANGQQQGPPLPLNAPMTSQGVQNMVPPASNHWQRDAMQMMQPPTQMSVSAASQWPAPTSNYSVPAASQETQPGLPGQAGLSARPTAVQMPNRTPSYLPPVHVSPSSSLPTRFTKKTGPLSEFRRAQLSDGSLIHRGPGLQDRISDMIAASRSKTADAKPQESIPQSGMQLPERDDETPPAPPVRMRRPTPQIKEPQISSQPLTRKPGRKPQANRLIEGQAESDTARAQMPTRSHQINVAQYSRRPAVENVGSVSNVNRLTEHQADSDVAQAAMSEPVLSEPIQDPFGDYPPLRSEPPADVPNRIARAQDRTQKPISVLSRPVRHRNETPNKIHLPSNRAVESYSEPDNGEPTYESEPHVMFRGDGDITESNENRFTEPSTEPFYEFDPEAQDALDSNLDQLEELPGSSGLNESFQDDQNESKQGAMDELDKAPVKRSCDEFRSRLLDNPITDISLDMSPPRNDQKKESILLSRTWMDRSGNVLATGTMTVLSRGYVVLDSGQKISRARLSDADNLAISDYWQIPEECSLGGELFAARCWIPQTVTWKASALCHKPLYFENVQLERYGHSHGPFLQPIASTGHFFASLFFLPYQAGIHPANECQYALGYYRPGNCAPWLKDPVPISLEGIKLQTLVMLGFAYIP